MTVVTSAQSLGRSGPLTARDLAILEFVQDSGGCTIDHIHARLWRPGSSKVPCYRRASVLVAGDYLAARRLPSATGQGSGKYFLTLGREGRRLLSELRDIPLAHLPQRRLVAPQQITHHFGIVSTKIVFELACERVPHVSMSRWTSEPYSRRAPLRVVDTYSNGAATRTRSIPLAPDAVFTLLHGAASQDFFLEVDRATMSTTNSRLAVKIRGYLRYQKHHPVPVLYVVPTQDRAQKIIGVILSEARDLLVDPRRALVTLQMLLSPATALLAPVWQQPGVSTAVALLPSPPMCMSA